MEDFLHFKNCSYTDKIISRFGGNLILASFSTWLLYVYMYVDLCVCVYDIYDIYEYVYCI